MSSVRVNFEGGGGKSLDGASVVMVYGEIPVFVNGEQVYTPKPQFQVGDFVRVVGDCGSGPAIGMVGTVMDVTEMNVDVQFPEFMRGHCGHEGVYPHHWYFGTIHEYGPISALELIDRPGRE